MKQETTCQGFVQSAATAKFEKILVLCLAGIGDTLLSTPFLKEIRLVYPKAVVDVLVMQNKAACEILSGNPNVDRVLYHNFMRANPIKSLLRCFELRRQRYDCSISPMPQNRFAYNLIAFLIGARIRIGFEYAIRCGTMEKWLLTTRIRENTQIHVVENNLLIIPEIFGNRLDQQSHRLEIFPSPENRQFAEDFVANRGLQEKQLICFHPGSGTTKNLALKRWSADKWAELARQICADPAFRVLLLGGPEEEELRRTICRMSGLPSDMLLDIASLRLLDTAALIAKIRCVVCADTLIAHIAAAVGTPVVCIFGPTSPAAAHPYGVRHVVVRTGIECSPCYGYSKYGIRCTNEMPMRCMKEITANMVTKAVSSLLPE